MEKRRGKKENWGVTEGKERRIINLTDGSEKPLSEWNKMKIICKGNTVKVWVNDIFVNDEGLNWKKKRKTQYKVKNA